MNRKLEIKWGIVFTLMMLLWMTLEKAFGLHDKHIDLHPVVSMFVMIPAILIYVLAIKEKKNKAYSGEITYSQSLMSGFLVTIVVTLLSPLCQYITSVWITPGYFQNVINYSVENNLMTLLEAENYFNLKNYLLMTTTMTPVMGVLTTLLVSLFIYTKKKN